MKTSLEPGHVQSRAPEGPENGAPWDSGPVPYQFLCLVAVLIMMLVDLQRGFRVIHLLTPLVGLMGVMSPRAAAPVLLLLTMVVTWVLNRFLLGQVEMRWYGLRSGDAILCGAVLTYMAAHYRLQGLTEFIFPRDPRRRLPERDWLGRRLVAPQPRAPRLADRGEIAFFVLAVPLWVLVGHLAWIGLDRPWNPVGWSAEINRLILLTWTLGSLSILAATVLSVWRHRQHDPAVAALILQDVVWNETRREQRRIARWRAFGRLKRRRENP